MYKITIYKSKYTEEKIEEYYSREKNAKEAIEIFIRIYYGKREEEIIEYENINSHNKSYGIFLNGMLTIVANLDKN